MGVRRLVEPCLRRPLALAAGLVAAAVVAIALVQPKSGSSPPRPPEQAPDPPRREPTTDRPRNGPGHAATRAATGPIAEPATQAKPLTDEGLESEDRSATAARIEGIAALDTRSQQTLLDYVRSHPSPLFAGPLSRSLEYLRGAPRLQMHTARAVLATLDLHYVAARPRFSGLANAEATSLAIGFTRLCLGYLDEWPPRAASDLRLVVHRTWCAVMNMVGSPDYDQDRALTGAVQQVSDRLNRALADLAANANPPPEQLLGTVAMAGPAGTSETSRLLLELYRAHDALGGGVHPMHEEEYVTSVGAALRSLPDAEARNRFAELLADQLRKQPTQKVLLTLLRLSGDPGLSPAVLGVVRDLTLKDEDLGKLQAEILARRQDIR